MAAAKRDDTDRSDARSARSFGKIKPDGKLYTNGVPSNGGKRRVVRAVRDVPQLGIAKDHGYVLVTPSSLPRDGQVTITSGNALDKTRHRRMPSSLFSEDWRGFSEVRPGTDGRTPDAGAPTLTSRPLPSSTPTVAEYRAALKSARMTPVAREVLKALYLSPEHGATARALTRKVGGKSTTVSSAALGGFGSLLRSSMRLPAKKGELKAGIIVSIEPAGASFTDGRLVMVPALVQAIRELNLFGKSSASVVPNPGDETGWLEQLAKSLRSRLLDTPVGIMLGPASSVAEETDSNGHSCAIGMLPGGKSGLFVFLDDSLGEDRRALWYGVWASSKDGIARAEEAGRRRWPNTQLWDGGEPPENFRYADPWLQHYSAREHYYGWQEEQDPDVSLQASDTLVDHIAGRLASLLAELGTSVPASDIDKLQLLDGFREATFRLEQALLRRLLLSGRATATCALCGQVYEAALLVAAHIKRRADADDAERRAVRENVMALCVFGCDALFERGYVSVDEKGTICLGPRTLATDAPKNWLQPIIGRKCGAWSAGSEPFFAAHRQRHELAATKSTT
jgi:hypothetical protein